MLKTSRCIALCALLFTSLGSLCLGETEPLFYIYHGQPKALTLDATRIAVRINPNVASSHAGAVPNSLATRGFSDADVVAQPVPGWMILNAQNALTTSRTNGHLAASARDASSVHALITSLLDSGDSTIEFISPVFRDKSGDPIILTPTLLIGFQDDFSGVRQSQLLAAVPEGAERRKVEFPQPHTQRWQLHSHDGFAALDQANALAQTPGVAYAELDMIVTGHADLIPTDPLFPQSWGLRNTGQSGGQAGFDMEATSAWDITTGSSSVIVLILDTGVQQDHPDINQITGKDFTSDAPSNPYGGPFGVYDNHGTWVAGCVSGLINNGIGTTGIAPGVKIASARCYNNGHSDGTYTFQFSWVVDALNWGQSIGARVSNNSNHYDTPSSEIENAYAITRANGMIHFASAGNDGTASISYPSSISSVNSVGAANRFGERSSFSQYGIGLKYLAPGEEIWTTDRTGSAGGVAGDYIEVYGTSFASPYAAGIAALIISQTPNVSVADIENQMQNSCRDMGVAGYDTDYGYGILDAYLAVAPRIISSLSVSAFTGTNFSYQIVTNGSPATFSASGLPTGLNLNTQTGVINGLPTLSGTYDIIITAVGPNMSASATLHIVISPPSPITLLAKLILPDGILEALIADPVRNRIYGANRSSKNIAVIDLASRLITQTIAVDGNARGMAISPDGSKLWATETGATDPGVAVVDLVNLAALPSFTVAHPDYNPPWSCVLTPDRKLLVGQTQFQMTRLDADTGVTEDSFSTTMYEPYFALGSDGATLYSGDMSSGRIHRFTLVNDKPVETASILGGPYLCLSPDQKTLYSIDTSNSVSDSTAAFDATTLSELHPIPNPGDWGLVAMSSDGIHLYRASHFYDSGKVDVIDTRSNQIVGTLGLNLNIVSQSNYFTDMVLDRTGRYLVLASYSQSSNDNNVVGQLWIFDTGYSSNQSNSSPPPPHTFLNISTRTFVQTGDNVEIGGFIIQGNQPKRVVLRAIGPSLTVYGLPAVPDPVLELHDSTGAIVVTNDNWNSHRQDVLNTGLAPSDEHEAVIVTTLAPGAYTAILRGLNGTTGTALFELYDVDPTNSRVFNISTRANVGTGDNVMIGGFIIGGGQPTDVIVRAIGPSLTQFGIGDALLDPVLNLYDGSGNIVSQNDDWRSDQEQAITDSGLAPSDDRESAILATLPPGAYTAIVRGKNNTTGVGLVEVYNLDAN